MPSLSPSEASSLISSFSAYLTIAIHSILYHRSLYPKASFRLGRAYNLAVWQSRHPGVCAWVRDAVEAAEAQIREAAVGRIGMSIHGPDHDVVERWIFDLDHGFPNFHVVDPHHHHHHHQLDVQDDVFGAAASTSLNLSDLHQSWRAALQRLAVVASSLPPTPDNCTFALALELRNDAAPPTQHPQLWIPSEPPLQPPSGHALRGRSTTPVRSVQAGPIFFDCWVERG
ncbi:hypothetical protein CP533_6735 [Ophiocordyceps camponoti-saundersi (nom. inval.)]|nr:hypothetical protein CP533_6735 [Ophiocordyceps camponoti-saundersi (nom. inval.)]